MEPKSSFLHKGIGKYKAFCPSAYTQTKMCILFSVGIQKVICSDFNINPELRVLSIAGEVSHLAVCGLWNQNNAFKSLRRFCGSTALLVRDLF